MATEIAAAYVALYTKMPGVKADIAKSLGSADVGGQATKMGRTFSAGFAGAVGGAVAAVTMKAISSIAGSINAAISRVDTINNFPKIMKNLGYSSDEAADSIAKMSDKLTGLPTALDTMAGTVQQLAPLTGGLAKATDLSLALNNALLAGGKSTDIQKNAMEQYTQMLAVGKPDMMAWRSMVTAMPGQMDQLSKSLVGADAKQTDLYAGLQDGTVSFDDFNDAILKLNDKGMDGFASFADQAKDSTNGIATSQANLQTSITRGLANLINKFQPQITAFMAGLTVTISTIFNALGAAFDWLSENADIVVPVLAGVAVALLVLLAPAMWAAIAATWAFTVALLANPMTWIVIGIIALVAAIVWLATNWDDVVAWITDVWGGFIGWITGVIDGFVGWWNSVWEGFSGFLTDIWDGIVGFVTDYVTALRFVITKIVTAISDTWNSIWTGISDFFTGIWDGIILTVHTVQNIFGTVFNAIGDIIRGAFQGVVSVVRGVINGIIDAVNGVIGGINLVAGAIGDAIGVNIHIGKIPRLADGALISASRGGSIVNVGEGRYDEAVIPLGGPQLEKVRDVFQPGSGRGEDSPPVKLDAATIKELISGLASVVRTQSRGGGFVNG